MGMDRAKSKRTDSAGTKWSSSGGDWREHTGSESCQPSLCSAIAPLASPTSGLWTSRSNPFCLRVVSFLSQRENRPFLHVHHPPSDECSDPVKDDRRDHDYNYVRHRLFSRNLHHHRKTDPEEIQAVESPDYGKNPQCRDQIEDARYPPCRRTVSRELDRLIHVLRGLELRRQGVDHPRKHEHTDHGEHKREYRLRKRSPHRHPEDSSDAKDRDADEPCNWPDRGEWKHVTKQQLADIQRLRVDNGPLLLRRHQDRLGARDEIHGVLWRGLGYWNSRAG